MPSDTQLVREGREGQPDEEGEVFESPLKKKIAAVFF
jgi:hypothetical protein